MDQPIPLRYLTAADVTAAMPPLEERLALAETSLRGLAGDAQLPPKIGFYPREAGSFAHAMPAYLPGTADDGSGDRLGMKWVIGMPENALRGLPNINALLLLNDPGTGLATAILDAGPITAQRTAAVSGVAMRAWAAPADPAHPRAAIVGAGVQGHSHVPVLASLLPGVEIAVFDRDTIRAERLAAAARALEGVADATVAGSAREAVEGADVVVTAVSFAAPHERQVMTNDWLTPNALVIPIDYATICSAEVARDASLFVTDHAGQFLANRETGQFDGYPVPEAIIGAVLDRPGPRPAGRIVVTHLGTGLADVVFGAAILARAEQLGLGTLLPR